jgi:hypothetical protein
MQPILECVLPYYTPKDIDNRINGFNFINVQTAENVPLVDLETNLLKLFVYGAVLKQHFSYNKIVN